MESLGQITSVRDKIRIASRPAIQALYKLIFEKDGDRTSRRKLREFSGFTFQDDSNEYRRKFEYSNTFNIGDLTSMCNVLGLSYVGTREDLRLRVVRALMDINSLVSKENPDEDGEEDDTVDDDISQHSRDNQSAILSNSDGQTDDDGSVENDKHEKRRKNKVNFALNFKDVEDSVRTFDGSSNYPVERWIADFEDAAMLFEWSDMQKLIFARKLLKGTAKIFLQSEGVVKSWKKLKAILEDEFSSKTSSADLHRMLAARKMKKEESVQEYYLSIKELASRGNIDKESVIQYVIDGIADEETNKILLYGAKDFADFKERLRTYERMKLAQDRRTTRGKESTKNKGDSSKQEKKGTKESTNRVLTCYNCGGSDHKANTCKYKEQGKKCFKCNKFGHEALNCSSNDSKDKTPAESKTTMNVELTGSIKRMCKEIIIDDIKVDALIDTGSQLCLLREDIYLKLNSKELLKSYTVITGIAQGEVKTLGCLQTIVSIDNDNYPLTFHIVPCNAMKMFVVIGIDFLSQAEVKITQDGISINKIEPRVFLTQINLTEEINASTDSIIDKETKETIENLITSYEPKKCKSTNIELSIVLKHETPIYQRPYKTSIREKEIIEEVVDEWIKEGIAEPCSSEFTSPILIVKKKDDFPRVCIDYRKINKVIVKDRFPLPLIEDQIDQLVEARIFSTIDLKNGFFHVSVAKENRKYTSFITHHGQYQFLKVPFGLCNSPPIFQRFINHIFRPLINDKVILLYLDNLIIISSDVKQGIEQLKSVLQVASDYGLEINKKKCQFMKTRITFLGYVIEDGRVFPSPDKLAAVMHFPEPRNVKDVQMFLGLTGYFRKFIEFYSIIAKPLTDLLQKNKPFSFNITEKEAFNKLKELLSKDPVLSIFNSKLETEVHTDACRDGYGAILLQRNPDDHKLHPVYYFSRKTNPAERNYTSYELEALAVVRALEKFRHYLLGINSK